MLLVNLCKNEYIRCNFRKLADKDKPLRVQLKESFVQANPPFNQAKDVEIELFSAAVFGGTPLAW